MARPCRGNMPRLRALLHGSLGPRAADRLRAHLDSCAGCRETFQRLERIQAICRDLGEQPLPEINYRQVETQVHWRLSQRPERSRLQIGWGPALAALGAAVVLGVLAGAWLSGGLRPEPAPRLVHEAVPPRPPPLAEREIGAVPTLISGEVLVQSGDEEPEPLEIERPVLQGERLITRAGEVALQWGEANGMRLPANSSLLLQRLTDRRQSLRLEHGFVLLEVQRTSDERVTVQTGQILVRVTGTRFAVGVDDQQAEVLVRRGQVMVSPRAGRWPRIDRPGKPPLQPANDGGVAVDEGHRLVIPLDGVPILGPLDDARRVDASLNLQPWLSLHRLLATSATLAVSATPPADLYFDHVELGRTRLALRGSTGRHLIELFDDGRLLRRQWVELGATGSGKLNLDLRPPARKPQLPPGIHDTFRRRAPLLRACYERHLKRDTELAGRLVLRLEIDAEGRPARAALQHDGLSEPQVGQCVLAAVRSWRFPAGDPVDLVYPIVFRPE